MILDTTFLIDLMKGKVEAIEKLKQLEQRGETLYITAPTVYELYIGIHLASIPAKEQKRVEDTIREQPTLPLDDKAAQIAGTIQGKLMKRGEPIDPIDALIAGIAIANRETIATRNTKHYSKIENLKVETY